MDAPEFERELTSERQAAPMTGLMLVITRGSNAHSP